MREILEKDGVKIEMYLNPDRSVNMQRMMHIEYLDENNELVEFDAYPTGGDKNPKFGTIQDQFEYANTLYRFDQVYAVAWVKNLKEFFDERPNLSPSAISQEAGYDARYLRYILSGERNMTSNMINKLKPILLKYGFGR